MLLVGLLIGAWQGFWIAFVRIPPFITTLAGMLVFRGLSNVVLEGMTVSLSSETFVKVFGGGANCYVPDLFGMEGFNLTCMIAGTFACVLYVLLQMKNRMAKVRKGYETESMVSMLVKTALICAVILLFTLRLSQYRGIPTALIWVLIVILVYAYITSNTTIGRYFYAVGFPVSIPIKYTFGLI